MPAPVRRRQAPEGTRKTCSRCGATKGTFFCHDAESGPEIFLCQQHSDEYEDVFSHVPVDKVNERRDQDERKYERQVEEALDSKANLDARPFVPQEVKMYRGKEIKICRTVIIMNASEFREFFGKEPLVKYTRNLKTIQVIDLYSPASCVLG